MTNICIIWKICKINSVRLKSCKNNINVYPDLDILSILYENVHLHKHLQRSHNLLTEHSGLILFLLTKSTNAV